MANEKSVTAYLGLGSNLHDPRIQLERAVDAIGRLPSTEVLRESPLYSSKAWGKTDQPDFLNMVVEICTALTPTALLRHCKQIEVEQGREKGERWGPRQIDIDILLYGTQTLESESLTIPHPRLWERAFVLRPLADLRPDLVSPGGSPIAEVLQSETIAGQGISLYDPPPTKPNHTR